jgi:hypothetical protein
MTTICRFVNIFWKRWKIQSMAGSGNAQTAIRAFIGTLFHRIMF